MKLVLLVTALGPALGGTGWFTGAMWLFWVGVAVCALVQIMNMSSGAMKLPVFPLLFITVGAVNVSPWYVGVGIGLLLWTALESVSELLMLAWLKIRRA